MFYEEEEKKPSRPIPKVTIVSTPGKPSAPADIVVKLLQGEGGSKDEDDSKDQKRLEPCDVGEGRDEDDELVDPHERLRECCRKNEECKELNELLQECNNRVNSREKTNETCVMELMDYVHCVEHCVAKDLFRYLK